MSAGEQPVFEVRLRSNRVQQELDSLKGVDYERVMARLRSLATDPRPQGCQQLYDSFYRVRVGDFRLIYLLDEDKKRIDVGAIRRRSEGTYRGIKRLFG